MEKAHDKALDNDHATGKAQEEKALTPLMRQYQSLKELAQDGFLLFRLGDFYEMFGSDAVRASQILGITLTTRDKKSKDPLPMAGLPYHSSESYIERLLATGTKVYIAEQTETTDEAFQRGGYKAIVERRITQTYSPALRYSEAAAHISEPMRIAIASLSKNNHVVLALLEPIRGEFFIQEFTSKADFASKFDMLGIVHMIEFKGVTLDLEALFKSLNLHLNSQILLERIPAYRFSKTDKLSALERQYQTRTLEALIPASQELSAGIEVWSELIGGMLAVMQSAHPGKSLSHLQPPKIYFEQTHLSMNSNAVMQLDLLPSSSALGSSQGENFSLLESLESPFTRGGLRALRDWIQRPLIEIQSLTERRQRVHEWCELWKKQSRELREFFQSIYELTPILSRLQVVQPNLKDVGRILITLEAAARTLDFLRKHSPHEASRLESVFLETQELSRELSHQLLIDEHGAASLKTTFSPEWSYLVAAADRATQKISDYEQAERLRSGISSLKIKYNRVFGYGIEISTAHSKSIPNNYERKQTLAQGERFTTKELQEMELHWVKVNEDKNNLEDQLLNHIYNLVNQNSGKLRQLSHTLAEMDALLSVARTSLRAGWVMAELEPHPMIEVRNLRHAILDQKLDSFVPNDLQLGGTDLTWPLGLILTGPNMGGKSTYMKQVALAIVLNQIGCAVPATRARLGIFRKILTRIGAHDSLSKGQSTFMVEMLELASILRDASEDSLLILDEIGRGTSTYDGMSLAQSALEFALYKKQSLILFATHYHELTHLESILARIHNAHFGAEITKQGLAFSHKVKSGRAVRSYGVEVAQMAGVPNPVITRARQIQKKLEENPTSAQLKLFDQVRFIEEEESRVAHTEDTVRLHEDTPHPVLEELKGLNLDELSPKQAWEILNTMKESISQASTGAGLTVPYSHEQANDASGLK